MFVTSAKSADDLKHEIKVLLIAELNLSERDPAAIADEAQLFAERQTGGLGLDSLDALQIAMVVEESFGVRIPEGDDARPIFRSVSSLAAFIVLQRDADVGIARAE